MFAVLVAVALQSSGPLAVVEGQFELLRTGDATWRTGYCYNQPVEAVRFERPFEGLRENSWQVADAAFELSFADGIAELRRKDGKTFECAELNLTTYTVRPEKDYYAFSPFSDGGVSVYTGHLMGAVLVHGEWRETEMAARYVGREGEKVITREPDRLVHQFVYFGHQDVLETDSLVAVIDPAMPVEARQDILDNVPAVNALLKEKFGFEPRSRYMLFMATELDAFDGHSVKGGTQPDQILFTLKGRGIPALIAKDPAHFPKITAHEVLHLWQTEHWLDTLGDDRPWVHEGSADALAFEIMRMTGGYDDEQYAAAWRRVEDDCLNALKETSVHAAPDAGRFDVVYSCGALVNRLVGEALSPTDPGEGIVRLWRAMADWPAEKRKLPSEALFFMTLDKLGFSDVQRTALKRFLAEQSADPVAALAELRATLQLNELKGGA